MHREIVTILLLQNRRDLALAYVGQVIARRGLFYHGTNTAFAKRILSEGFVPNPRKQIWDGETGAQQSYTGTYFTTRITTANRYADGAVRKFGGHPVVFEVQLETKTGVFDEDEIAPVAGAVLMQIYQQPDMKGLLTHEAAAKLLDTPPRLFGFSEAVLTDWIGTGEENDRKQPFAQLYRSRYGDVPIHPQYYEAVTKAVRAAIKAFLEDVVATRKTDGGKRYQQANTKLLKAINLSKYGPQPKGSWTQNIRIMEPVRFRGANKIVAAVSRKIDVDYAEKVKTNTYYVLYGKLSTAFVTDDDDRWASVHNIVKKGWPH